MSKNCISRRDINLPLGDFLIFDLLYHVIKTVESEIRLGNFKARKADENICSNDYKINPWEKGSMLMNSLRKKTVEGIMGKTSFSDDHYMVNNIEILQKPSGFDGTENFNSHPLNGYFNKGIEITFESYPLFNQPKLKGIFLRVVTIVEEPFVFRVPCEQLVNTNRICYSGFAIELFDKLKFLLGFDYEIYEVEDNKYGRELGNSSWNGMIGDIINGKADISVAAMTITSDRELAVDFTKRFMDYSVGILMLKPDESTDLWSFIRPFDVTVWTTIVLATLLVCMVLSVVTRINEKQLNPMCSSEEQKFDKEVQRNYATIPSAIIGSAFLRKENFPRKTESHRNSMITMYKRNPTGWVPFIRAFQISASI